RQFSFLPRRPSFFLDLDGGGVSPLMNVNVRPAFGWHRSSCSLTDPPPIALLCVETRPHLQGKDVQKSLKQPVSPAQALTSGCTRRLAVYNTQARKRRKVNCLTREGWSFAKHQRSIKRGRVHLAVPLESKGREASGDRAPHEALRSAPLVENAGRCAIKHLHKIRIPERVQKADADPLA